MIVRSLTVALLSILLLASACVRRTTVQNFGLKAPRSVKSPDASLRAIFQQQAKSAFDPLTDDARVQALKNRIKANREDTAARLELGAVYESYRFYNDALEQYTNALEAGGALAEQSILGVVRCDQALDRNWQAIPLLEQFVKESPSANVWNALGLLYNAAGNLSAGESALREAVGATAASIQLHNNLGYTLLLQNKLEGAEAEFRKELDANPNSAAAHNNLGVLLTRRGDLQGALEQFEFTADEAVSRNNLAVVLMEMGKYEQSRDQLVKALAIRRNFGPALANFKLVQEGIRERAESQKAGHLPQSNVRLASAEQEASPLKDPEER
jgi:tetratricopeptide (TPR) repeat protein